MATATKAKTRSKTLKLDADVSKRLDQLAKGRGRSAHFLLIEAVNNFVAREEKRQAFTAEALARWQEFELTGIDVPHAQVKKRLAALKGKAAKVKK